MRNGLVPIRNVLDHLGEAHRSGPGDLSDAYAARSRTLVESLDYLGHLADQYRAVAVHGRKDRVDLAVAGPVGHRVVRGGAGRGAHRRSAG